MRAGRPRAKLGPAGTWMLVGVLAVAAVAAGDEPEWSGPRGDPAARGAVDAPALLKELAGVAWKVHLAGPVTAGPVLADGAVCVATEAGEIVALDLATGWVRWRARVEGSVVATPVRVGATLVCVTGEGLLFGLALADGRETARVALGEPVDTAPVPAGGRVFVATRAGDLVARDWPSGRPAWRQPTGGAVAAAPAVAGTSVVVVTGTPALAAFALTDGRPLWRQPLPAPAPGGVALADGLVAVATADARGLGFRLADGEPVWNVELPGPAVGPPALGPRRCIIATEHEGVVALDRRDGRERWRRALDPAAPVRLGPVIADRLVLVATADGLVHVLEEMEGRPQGPFWPCGQPARESDATGAADLRLAPHAFGFVAVRPDGAVAAVRDPRGDRRLLDPLLGLAAPASAGRLEALVATLEGPDGARAAQALCAAGPAARPVLVRALLDAPPAREAIVHALAEHLAPLAVLADSYTDRLGRGLARQKFLLHCLAHPDPALARAAAERYVAEPPTRRLDGFDPAAPFERRRAYAEAQLKIVRD